MSSCAACDKPIQGTTISALEKKWHPECFVCGGCRIPFSEKSFHTREGKPFCEGCYLHLHAPKCSGCTKPISGSYTTALEGTWHSKCFVCQSCRKSFEKKSFYVMDGKPYCEKDYKALSR